MKYDWVLKASKLDLSSERIQVWPDPCRPCSSTPAKSSLENKKSQRFSDGTMLMDNTMQNDKTISRRTFIRTAVSLPR